MIGIFSYFVPLAGDRFLFANAPPPTPHTRKSLKNALTCFQICSNFYVFTWVRLSSRKYFLLTFAPSTRVCTKLQQKCRNYTEHVRWMTYRAIIWINLLFFFFCCYLSLETFRPNTGQHNVFLICTWRNANERISSAVFGANMAAIYKSQGTNHQ